MAKRGGKVTSITSTVTDKNREDYGKTYTVKVVKTREGTRQEYINKEGNIVQTREISGGVLTTTQNSQPQQTSDQEIINAGIKAGQSPDTIYKVQSGGFSADPKELQRRQNDLDATRQSISPQVQQNRETEYRVFNTAYGGKYIPPESRSREIKKPQTKIDVFVGNVGETYEDVNKQFSSGIIKPVTDVVGNFPRYGGGGDQPLVNVPYVDEIGSESKNYIRERPLDVAVNVYAGYGIGRISKIPFIAGVVSRPTVKAVAFGAYGLGVSSRISSGESVPRVLAQEGINLGAFSLGLSGGLKTKGFPLESIYPKSNPKVSRIEATRYNSDAVNFDGNIVTPNGDVQSGRFTTATTGFYKVNNRYYKLSSAEQGTTLKQNDAISEIMSQGKIKIQSFKYVPKAGTLKANVGRPKVASINTRGLVVESDSVAKVNSYSQIVGKGFRFNRVTRANIKINDLDYTLVGTSADYLGTKSIPSSRNIIRGEGSTIIRSNSITPYGEPYSYTKTEGFAFAKEKGLTPTFTPKSNVKAYNREQFIQGARQSVGLVTTNAYSPTAQVSNVQSTQLLKSVYKVDTARAYTKSVSKIKLAGSVNVEQPKSITRNVKQVSYQNVKISQKYFQIPKTTQETTQTSTNKQYVSYSQKSSNILGFRNVQVPATLNKSLTAQKQETTQSTMLKQASLTKQVSKTKNPYNSLIRIPRLPAVNIPSLTLGFFGGKKGYKRYSDKKPSKKDISVYAIPDLLSVSQTEGYNYSRFGKGEAISPRLTSSVRDATLNAFSGRGLGRIPTYQQQKRGGLI